MLGLHDAALLIFGRYPRLGRVKTRLGRHFPAEDVLEIYEAFLLDTIECALRGGSWETILYLADSSAQETTTWRNRHQLPDSLIVHPQTGDDLGERLWNACRAGFEQFSRIVFIGADTPGLPTHLISQAFEDLRHHQVVLGPVPDGGYYLLGLSRARRDLFFGIDWGSERVLQQTLEKISPENFVLLPEWNDVDERQDLQELARRLERGGGTLARRTASLLPRLLQQRGESEE